ncbi:UNVERIFIED_CONTAM: Early nodulin-16 [Sesamum indicum]
MADYIKSCVVLMFLMMAFLEGSMGAVYKVGDSAGWTNTGVDYEKWASAHTFKVGDTVVFNYDKESNDVTRVTQENYETCNSNDPIETFNSGDDELEYSTPGNFYYICSFPNRCLNNKQKVEINVSPSGNDTTPSPPAGTSTSPPGTSPSSPGTNSTPPAGVCKRNTTASASPRPFNKHLGGLLVFASCALALYLH